MKSVLLFDFSVDKENKCVTVKREFAASKELVWEAWTNPELLDLWWAPKPYQVITKSMDFREGGTWFYGMHGPTGDVHWCKADYIRIVPQEYYSALDAFCDENGKLNEEFPRSEWNNTFRADGENTIVNIVIQYKSLADLERIIELGFKEGFTMAMGNLDIYLASRMKLWSGLKKENKARVCSYLNFPGNTEEAFLFYRKVFKSEFNGGIQRFGELPPDENQPAMSENLKKMVLHVELPIMGNHVLMATDAPAEMGFTVTQGNNMFISIEPETKEETERIFNELSEGGNITMPLTDMFWGAYFGSFTDKYGINWMLNFLYQKG